MKIYLLDNNEKMIYYWNKYFAGVKNVEIVKDDFENFVSTHDAVDCIVSPANSFGLMDGGYDLAITNHFGDALQAKVQDYIIKNFDGEQPVGTSFIVNIPDTNKTLIHTPTMRKPSMIKDPLVVYYATRETLRTAHKNNVKNIVVPAFGGGAGAVDAEIIAKFMKTAYDSVKEKPPTKISWDYAEKIKGI